MITQAETRRFIKLWCDIQSRQHDLDREVDKIMWDLRARFDDADPVEGDNQFKDWCMRNIGLSEIEARKYLIRARAALVFKDVGGNKQFGGTKAIEKIALLPRATQTKILSLAKDKKLAVDDAAIEIGELEPREPRVNKFKTDAQILADFINEWLLPNMEPPTSTMDVIKKYIPAEKLKQTPVKAKPVARIRKEA